MKNGKVLKIVWLISFIISIVVFVMTAIVLSDTYEIYNETYYLPLLIIEIINIIFGVLFFRKNKITKSYVIIYLILILITFFIPIYHNGNTYAPTGPNSHLMGLAFNERYLNIYGINIIKIINIFK